jgi:putative salt-induced outer membrane protein YdiY
MGGGGGYQWIESDDMNFSTELGLASLYEKFYNRATANKELSAQLGYYYDKKLIKTVKFIHNLTYYPSTDDLSDYFLSTTAEIRANFTERMFTNFKIILDHDATPAPGAKTTDVKYILSVGFGF